ncbi:MAG: hypothetical protein JW798_16860 [Prolixibacteraceae bacterium]|nr:hypothetical protein [Prolixibacteraceae bacterium]
MKNFFPAAIFLFFFAGVSVNAQSLFDSSVKNTGTKNSFSLNGYVRGSVYGAGETYDITNGFGEVSLKAGLKTGNIRFSSDIRFRSGYAYNERRNELEIKEAYAGYSSNSLDIFLGEQIITWGRTDGFNPTNNVTPMNYFFFSGNPDDQLMPNLMLRANWRITHTINWEIIALPVFRPSIYRYNFFRVGENASFVEEILPEKTFKNAGLASRLNFEFSGIGFSFSYFRGYDPFYGFDVNSISFDTGEPVITFIPAFYQKSTAGFDMALPIGPVIWRNEAAYNFTENEDDKIYIPSLGLSYVTALEYSIGNITLLAQYIGNYVPDYNPLFEPELTDPTNPMALMQYATETVYYEAEIYNRKIFKQDEKFHHAISATISGRFIRETLNVEFSGFYNITTEEYLIRPKIELSIGNGLSISSGYMFMEGPDGSIFNQTSPIMNGAFLEFKASF